MNLLLFPPFKLLPVMTESLLYIFILRKFKKCMVLFVYLLIKENLYLKSYLSGSKIGINAFIREGGGLIRGVTQVLRTDGLICGLGEGGGGVIGGESTVSQNST